MARCSNGHEAAPDTADKKFCTVCGAPMMVTCPNGHEVEPAAYCTVCGVPLTADAPEPITPPWSEPPDPEASRRSWFVIGGVAMLVLLIGAGAYFGVTNLSGSNGNHATSAVQTSATGPPLPAAPSTESSSTESSAPQTPTASTAPPAVPPPSTTTVVQPPPSATSPSAVVEQYFADINAGDYASAWAIGGRNLQGGNFDSFVQGFATTVSDSVTIVSTNGDTVQMQLDALQTDGTHKHFAGTYTVRDGLIVAANVRQTG